VRGIGGVGGANMGRVGSRSRGGRRLTLPPRRILRSSDCRSIPYSLDGPVHSSIATQTSHELATVPSKGSFVNGAGALQLPRPSPLLSRDAGSLGYARWMRVNLRDAASLESGCIEVGCEAVGQTPDLRSGVGGTVGTEGGSTIDIIPLPWMEVSLMKTTYRASS